MKRFRPSVHYLDMDHRITAILTILDRDWRRDHRIEDLATVVNLRASRLQHLFKAEVRRSIREVILARRLDEAATLVASTYERISDIAYFVGFRDVSNFNHAFRRRFGLSPRGHRAGKQAIAGHTAFLQDRPSQTTSDQVIPLVAASRPDEIE